MDTRKTALVLALALQLALPSLLTLVYPCEVLRAAGSAPLAMENTLSLTLLALAVAVVLQSLRRGPVGSGLLLPSLSSGLHLAPSLLAVKAGGLPLVAGMTVFAGLAEMGFSFFVFRVRALFSSTVVGLILFLVGIEIVLSGLQAILNEPGAGTMGVAIAAGVALALAWKKGSPLVKTLAPLVAFVVAGAIGRMIQRPEIVSFPWFGWPALPETRFDFRFDLLLPFLAVAVAAGIRTLGGVRILNQDEHRDGGLRIAPGIRGDATGTILCGLAGSIGTCVALNSIPAERSAGTGNPGISWIVAAVFVLVALCPALLGFVVMAPGCAIGPLLVYYGILMAIPGVQEIRKDRALPGFAWQAGLPLGLAAMALLHQESLRFGGKPWPPLLENFTGSLMTVGVASALIVRICLQIWRKKS